MARASLITALCFGLLSGASLASAQDVAAPVDPIDIPPENDPLAHAWDRPGDRGGFYLRGTLGLGVESARLGPPSWKNDSQGRFARGFGTGYTLDVGGFLAPWVALHLNAHAGVLWSGSLDYDLAVAAEVEDNIRIAGFGFAPAATFFVPHDFFFSTAFGTGFARLKSGEYENTTKPGFYMNLAAGKDLYHDNNVAVGLSFQVSYMLLGDDKQVDEARLREFLFGVSVAYDSI